ncbi:gephyrin-like molybdotransferase Glp [Desulfopila sp. IMCC35008]|uniref:molybdopterin molybdotransferase MoeA n=1 Tax=Desulfopila sp. IMCC35008 TaxID=2653858 RepID=UPI0013D0E168|nr:gephyrin-like molybdotransferase Glp [Desulfopila sp. IMCC35008]
MISVSEALEILKNNLPEPRIVRVSINEAFSRRLAEDIHSPEPSPRYTSSAMDGYAVRWADLHELRDDTPVSLNVVGESQAGVPYAVRLEAGEAVRISTGAMIPEGSDTVIRVEDTEEEGGIVLIRKCKKEGQDVRHAGEEFGQGAKILDKGLVLKARQIALLSAIGCNSIPVYDKPRVSLFITGTELAHHGDEEIKPFQVRDSNDPMLQSAIKEAGGVVAESLHVEDDLEVTVRQLRMALEKQSDIILCSGGVSVGRHDHVKEAAEMVGFDELFWKIRQKPGKPLYVARRNRTLLFGLPGNPVSAFMCFQNFVMPSLASLQGVQYLKKTITAEAEVPVVNMGKRTDFIRVDITNEPNSVPTFRPIARQGSHMLTSIVEADGYIAVEPGCDLKPGDLAEVFVF